MAKRPPQFKPPRKAPVFSKKKQQAKQYDKRRGSSNSRGYTHRWRRYSERFREANPYCMTVGCFALSQEVDHKIPVNGSDDPLFWDVGNHQALCKSCHSRKTARYDGGFRGLHYNSERKLK